MPTTLLLAPPDFQTFLQKSICPYLSASIPSNAKASQSILSNWGHNKSLASRRPTRSRSSSLHMFSNYCRKVRFYFVFAKTYNVIWQAQVWCVRPERLSTELLVMLLRKCTGYRASLLCTKAGYCAVHCTAILKRVRTAFSSHKDRLPSQQACSGASGLLYSCMEGADMVFCCVAT